MKHYFSKTRGFSLVEMLIYIAILVVILMVLIQTLLSFSSNYKTVSTLRLVERSATESLERMTRDIRNATSVGGASVLNSSPGELTIVATQGSNSTTTRFYVSSGALRVDVNGTYIGPLTTSKVTVTNLVFRSLTSSYSTAVKIDMTLQGVFGSVTQTRSYNSTVILKGS